MRAHKIYGMVLRYFFLMRHGLTHIVEVFYWPVIELTLWGITSKFIEQITDSNLNIITIITSGILMWILVWQTQNQISVNTLEELWNTNLVNIFITPIRVSEWLASVFIVGFIKACLGIIFASIVTVILYHTGIFKYGIQIIPFLFCLLMFGWTLGMFISGLIIRYGKKIEIFAWSIPAFMAPFSGIYYPTNILPEAARIFSSFIPASYVFEGMREVIQTGELSWDYFYVSLFLNLIYITLAFIYFKSSFKYALNKGLINLK